MTNTCWEGMPGGTSHFSWCILSSEQTRAWSAGGPTSSHSWIS